MIVNKVSNVVYKQNKVTPLYLSNSYKLIALKIPHFASFIAGPCINFGSILSSRNTSKTAYEGKDF